MNSSYTHVVLCLFLFVVGIRPSLANPASPVLFDCNTDTLSLCLDDEGVSLPDNNKIYLGENHPDATSCSVHVSQSIKVQPGCLGEVQYEVQLFLFDAGDPIILQSGATTVTDSLNEAELFFDSELSADTIISQNGIPYTTGCERYHRIKWIVTDSCGQVSACEQLIDLYDCSGGSFSEPSNTLIVTFGCGETMTVRLNEIISGISDDCSKEEDFLFSWEYDLYKPDSIFNKCYVPAYGVELTYNFWMADNGNDINCDSIISWTERNRQREQIVIVFTENGCAPCEPEEDNFLFGEIVTEDIQSVTNVTVTISSPGHIYPTYITAEDGKYNFYYLLGGEDYTIKAERNDWHRNGVSTLDLVRILKHLLGVESINSPYDLIAADANNSSSVSAIDLVELRKLILGIYTELPQNESWRFVPENFIFDDPTHPSPFDEELTVNVNGPVYNVDFVAVKIGDVNNTVQANATIVLPRNSPWIKILAPQKHYSKNEIIEIPISLQALKEIQGFQFTISSPELEFISVASNTIDISDEHYSLFGDKITMSWFDVEGIAFDKEDVIFTLKAIAKKNGSLKSGFSINSEITEAEVYSMEDEIFTPQLLIHDDNEVNTLTLMPNPWKEQTTIAINLTQDGNTEVEIMDLNGRQIFSETKYLVKGNNEIVFESKNFDARGLMLYSIKTGQEVFSGKMVVWE